MSKCFWCEKKFKPTRKYGSSSCSDCYKGAIKVIEAFCKRAKARRKTLKTKYVVRRSKMKVNGNDRSFDFEVHESGNGIACGAISNIPVRITLAIQVMASDVSVSAETALRCADALIATHNSQQAEEAK